MTKTLVTVLGARPQFIKASALSSVLARRDDIREILVHTGQHFDAGMSDIFFEELGIPAPAHHLGVSGGGHGAMTGAMLQKLEPLFEEIAPDLVLVYGDTNSTLAGALTAAKLHIPVAHVEAGLRSFNRRMPEELNRILTDHLAELLFTPTEAATANLRHEGVPDARIHEVGDVMYDVALLHGARAESRSSILRQLGLEAGRYVLATVHRAENTDDGARLEAVMTGLDRMARQMPVVLPLHPRTAGALKRHGIVPREIRFIDPVGYLDMIALEKNAAVIATDSGGVQKEAYFHGVPCVTLRDETEWVELVDLGWNRLAPPLGCDIAQEILSAPGRKGRSAKPYGEGRAAQMIVAQLLASS